MLWKSSPRLKEIQTQGALTDLHQSPEQEREVERGTSGDARLEACLLRGLPVNRRELAVCSRDSNPDLFLEREPALSAVPPCSE
jgi:hypothetical protein